MAKTKDRSSQCHVHEVGAEEKGFDEEKGDVSWLIVFRKTPQKKKFSPLGEKRLSNANTKEGHTESKRWGLGLATIRQREGAPLPREKKRGPKREKPKRRGC